MGPSKGISFHFALQTGQIWLPCFTFEVMQWKWKECEHSAVKIACPCPRFIEVKHIAQVFLEDLLALLDSLKPPDDGVGVIGIDGESKAASDNLSAESSSSAVAGT